MHPGYPIIGVVTQAQVHINGTKERIGGPLHELGHNHQLRAHTLTTHQETTCDIYAMYANTKVLDAPSRPSWFFKAGSNIGDYIMRGKPFDTHYKAITAKMSYRLFLEEYGWDVWRDIMKIYLGTSEFPEVDVVVETNEDEGDESDESDDEEDNDDEVDFDHEKVNKPSRNDLVINQKKADKFALLTCHVAKVNAVPHWEWWGYRLSTETKDACSKYPAMKKDLNLDYHNLDPAAVTEHRINCPDQWLPFGDSCFYFSNEEVDWLNAEEKCQSLNEDSHLASCLTSQEGFFIAKKVYYEDLPSHQIGIHSL